MSDCKHEKWTPKKIKEEGKNFDLFSFNMCNEHRVANLCIHCGLIYGETPDYADEEKWSAIKLQDEVKE